ncbi:hypothetical protein SAMN06265375_103110 [Muriicola jejuensis]|uniref:Glycosyl transferase n=1 Tax=Muriicola jejuensis TaxID=504488 RepID=A0A6P0UE47_9FLAO|nr:hypothetical protein [Muriicola jejuensis]NER11524.1 hypothetical protein [Muriicola jejuensis]SMP20075.1 hypothetical protein SAMN06265375_103110 [Muriicola jejuensis]
MIYLKVRGGLCNRIRTLDSLLILSARYNKDLTVLWPLDSALNVSYHELFQPVENSRVKLEIIDCPPGYPEKYYSGICNMIKNLVKGRILDQRLRSIVKRLEKLPKGSVLSESYLDKLYNDIIAHSSSTVTLMDNFFIKGIKNQVDNLMQSDKPVYINSCYRLEELEDNYGKFLPQGEIIEKIIGTTDRFKNTYGLHIRRTDHTSAKVHSSTEKFISLIEDILQNENDATFFLSTDDPRTKSELIKKYGDRIIYNDIQSFDRNKSEAAKEAVLDLFCLSKTKKVFGSHHSSFSQVAAQIGNIPEITVK